MAISKNEPKNSIDESNSLTFTAKFLRNTNNDDIINTEIAVPLKHLNEFLETPWNALN